MPNVRNIYGVMHRKGPCDTCTGRVKQGITWLVRSGTEVVNLAVSFYDIAKKQLETDSVPFDKCQHFCKHSTLQMNCHKGPLYISGQQCLILGNCKVLATQKAQSAECKENCLLLQTLYSRPR